MNEFNQQIQQAAARQRLFILSLTITLAVSALIVGAFAFLLKGTPLQIRPADANRTASVEVTGGIAYLFEGTLFSLSRSPVIRVSSEGFKPAEKTISPDQEGHTLTVTLEELPARLLLGTSLEEDVEWRINDIPVAVSPSLDHELKAGNYKISIFHKYHQPESWDLTVGRGESYEETVPLRKVEGKIAISATPEGARLFIDDEPQENLPISIKKPGGAYALRLEKENYTTIEETVEVTRQIPNIIRNYRMQLLQSYLSVSLKPFGGSFTVNGKPVRDASRLPVGATKSYYVRYQKEGYYTFEQKIKVLPGETKKIDIRLKPEIAEVALTSTPSATVLIDGQPMGQTPLTLRLPAKKHKVSFVKKGYRTLKKTIRPSAVSPVRLSVKLVTEQSARLAEAKRNYRNSAGMSMLLFKPGTVTLGAPRHEKGQRANEFLRDVQLTRHFYVSKNEVTEKQFAAFRASGGAGASSLPVANISWNEAAAFCNWLSKKEGFTPFYRFKGKRYAGFDATSNGYRLPSEAEWEWLARKAGRKKQSRFPWGNDSVIPPGSGNIADESAKGVTRFYVPNYTDGHAKASPVGSFSPGKAGLNDLFGNVSEWVHDYYSLIPPPKGSVLRDPLGDQAGDKHVIKGASWSSGTLTEIRPSYRQASDKGSPEVGFRVARYL